LAGAGTASGAILGGATRRDEAGQKQEERQRLADNREKERKHARDQTPKIAKGCE